MDDELLKFYHHKKMLEHCGYKIIVFENDKVTNISKYLISIFNGNKKIGEVETENMIDAVKKIKGRIDRSENNGGKLIFMRL
jgi:hypothetical protein